MFMALFDSINQLQTSRRGTSRRLFLFSAVGAVVGYFGFRWWRDRPRPIPQIQTRFITPNSSFYLTQIDAGFRPRIEAQAWQLKFAGLDGKSFALTYDELTRLERRKIFKTFSCVGNTVGGPAVGNGEWTVTPLAPLLERLLPAKRDGLSVVMYGLDGFHSSVPLDIALSDQAFIAYEMNGAALPMAHGWPARALLPGKYGMKQPRWLERIEITDGWVSGYWEKRGWSYDGDVRMTARVDSAIKQTDGSWLVTGMAYCGAQPVVRVEFSDNEGDSWQQAEITSEKYPNTWATWQFNWKPTTTGEIILTARVADQSGKRQIESYTGSFPAGATGLHRVIVTV
jgi:DMSO/TMAO reductase YedYZ molybdopterin-dependent catalytic subunit